MPAPIPDDVLLSVLAHRDTGLTESQSAGVCLALLTEPPQAIFMRLQSPADGRSTDVKGRILDRFDLPSLARPKAGDIR